MGQRQVLRQEIELRALDSDNAIASDSQINDWINQSIRHISTTWNWPFMRKRGSVTVLANQSTAVLTADVRQIFKATLSTGAELFPVTDRWMQDNISPTATGPPQYFTDGGYTQNDLTTAAGRTIRVAPQPTINTAVTISYFIEPSLPTVDTHFTPFPAVFDEAIILWGMKQYARFTDDDRRIADADTNFESELQRLIRAYGRFGQERFDVALGDRPQPSKG